MHKNTILFVIIAALAGFIVGFWLANSINRTAMNSPGSQNERAVAGNANTLQGANENELSGEEIRTKIAEADRNPNNFAFQKDLFNGLFKQDRRFSDPGI